MVLDVMTVVIIYSLLNLPVSESYLLDDLQAKKIATAIENSVEQLLAVAYAKNPLSRK